MKVSYKDQKYRLIVNQLELEAMLDCLFDGCGESTDEARLITKMCDRLHEAWMEQTINKE